MSKIVRTLDQVSPTRWQAPNVGQTRQAYSTEELEAIEQQARAKGFEAGHSEGLMAGRQAAQDGAQRLAILYDSAANAFRQISEDVESELAKLATAIAQEVIRQELKAEPKLILAIVNQACSVLSASARDVDVHINPKDLAIVKEGLKEAAPAQRWRLIEDRNLARGECQINSSAEFVDATLQARIDGILASLLSENFGGET